MSERRNGGVAQQFEQINPYEQDLNAQRMFDAFLQLGKELSVVKIGSQEAANQIAQETNSRLFDIAQHGVAINHSVLLVSGESVKRTNFSHVADGAGYVTSIDTENPMVPIGVGEERPLRPQSLRATSWEDEEAGCWRVGLKMRGPDTQGSLNTAITTINNGLPVLSINIQGYLEVSFDENVQIQVETLARKRERDESIARLRGHFNSGIVRLLKTVDIEMDRGGSDQYQELRHIQNLRLLGRYGMDIVELKKADLLNTAITKVLNRSDERVIIAGKSYEKDDDEHSVDSPSFTTISGIVADVIPEIPVSTGGAIGPSLVVIGPNGRIDKPSYMPIKDLTTVKY